MTVAPASRSLGERGGSQARQTRALRGVAAAAVTTVVAATAHTFAGGGAPPPLFVAAVLLLASPVCVALVGRTLTLWRLALAVLMSQAVFHVAFALTSGAATDRITGHSHHAAVTLDAPASAAAVVVDPLMLLGHGIAALLTVIALLHGERMLCAVARGILRLLRPRFEAWRPSFATPPMPRLDAERSILSPVFVSELSRRGPPLGARAR